MKLPSRPWLIVAPLVLGLVGVWGWSSRANRHAVDSRQSGMTATVTGAESRTNSGAASGAETNRLWPDTPIDLAAAESTFFRVAEAATRDPFQAKLAESPAPGLSPINQLKLSAVWCQSGSRAVVINDRVFLEGDTVAGFQIERVEAEQVWLKGPEKTEPLTFYRGDHAVPPPLIKNGAVPRRGVLGAPAEPVVKPKT